MDCGKGAGGHWKPQPGVRFAFVNLSAADSHQLSVIAIVVGATRINLGGERSIALTRIDGGEACSENQNTKDQPDATCEQRAI